MYKGVRKTFRIGEVSAEDASTHKADTERRLRLLKNNMIEIRHCTIENYLLHKGHLPEPAKPCTAGTTSLHAG
jgi:hypothetical protein